MSIRNIIEGHYNEIFDKNSETYNKRILICQKCSLLTKTWYGLVCSAVKEEDGRKGCGCRVEAKTRDEYSKCPLGKW